MIQISSADTDRRNWRKTTEQKTTVKNSSLFFTLPAKKKKKNQKMPMTCLVLQEAVPGRRVEQSLSRREPKNRLRQGLRSSDQPQAW